MQIGYLEEIEKVLSLYKPFFLSLSISLLRVGILLNDALGSFMIGQAPWYEINSLLEQWSWNKGSERKKRAEVVFVIDIRRQVAWFSNRLISHLDSEVGWPAWGFDREEFISTWDSFLCACHYRTLELIDQPGEWITFAARLVNY